MTNWTFSSEEASSLQQELATHVERTTQLNQVRYIAGVDVHIHNEVGRAAIVVLDFATLKPIDVGTALRPVTFAYKPGLLAFREGPIIFDAFERLEIRPDLLIFDGHGIAHPRRLGIASHLGVMLNLPTIGCARAPSLGHHGNLSKSKGSYTLIFDESEVIGAAVRSHDNGKPLYVSIGHRVDLTDSIKYVLACCRDYRLPETTRWADKIERRVEKPKFK